MPMYIAQMLNSPLIEKYSLKSLQNIISIGAKFPTELRRKIEMYLSASCKINDNYGCSERASIMMEISEGKVIPFYNVEIKIIDECGNSLGPNQNGQICVRKNMAWSGYYGNQEATEDVYDKAGEWYKTGDMGNFDEDGYFHFVERIKDIIRLEIIDISPAEIEEIILQIPDITQCCVFGIPDELKFNILGALVIKKDGSGVTEEDVEKFVIAKAPDYISIAFTGGSYFADSFPLTSSGKIIRKEVAVIGKKLYEAKKLKK